MLALADPPMLSHLLLESPWALVATGIVLGLALRTLAKQRGDKKLEKIFGDPWREWSSTTPALIPKSIAPKSGDGDSWSFAKSMNQNYEPVIVAYSLFWLWWLSTQLPAAAG